MLRVWHLVDDLSPTGFPQVVQETVNGAVTRTYTYGLQRISQDQVISNNWTSSFYGYDGGGNVRLLTDSSGNITDTYEYDAFGNQISTTGSTPNEFLYRGEQWDPDLSLYYLRARYYNPVTGRFMSQDTYNGEVHDPASLHRYRYANGNPANFVDPSGNDAASELAFNIGYRFGQEIGEAAELGAGILCVYNAEAAGIDLVNHWTSDTRVQKAMRITTLGLTAAGCAAIIKGIGGPPELEPVEPESGEFSPTICPMCFAAGTPVHTEHGEEPIEKLKVGERVYALDRATGKTELEPITALVPMHKGNLVELKVQGDSESLRPSVRHPFWVKLSAADRGHWIEAANLRKGELLETIAGKWSKIEAVVPVKQEETVYNFTVANDHDYFVGETGFLVHNAGPCGCRFIGTPLGQLIAVPLGYVAMTALNGKGLVLLPDGQPLGNNSNIIRWEEPSPKYPNGAFRYYNNAGQPLNPLTGKPGSQPETHIEPDCPGPWKGLP